eukprot:gnl/TRDRNA2_/TRDRNA2_85782_c0_seq1.p1 gnl/TRDRNA2_/TRDRNA2_85782_c0~~gnl/TRDRNA2_/TRDRNA2_85782_c0_seq1.p1  ORF type:complete len:240 (+),score=48.76 gnl/TRDRNA2_/TRDRNA2_85782_c0_seq1:64-783(+)
MFTLASTRGLAAGWQATAVGSIRTITSKKYARQGFWGRGEHGRYTMDDPRIFKPPPRRKYPYFKQRQWSKPYICTNFSQTVPGGSAAQLVITYVPWSEPSPDRQGERSWKGAVDVYYTLRNALQAVLPSAQIQGEPEPDMFSSDPSDDEQAALRVIRVSDGRTLLRLGKDEVARRANSDEEIERLVIEKLDGPSGLLASAMDCFEWRYQTSRAGNEEEEDAESMRELTGSDDTDSPLQT